MNSATFIENPSVARLTIDSPAQTKPAARIDDFHSVTLFPGQLQCLIDRGIMSPVDYNAASRQMGIDQLIEQVARIVRESGNPEAFDAAAWTLSWLERPIPSLGWRRPIEYMDSEEGRALIFQTVAQMQSGAYA